MVAHLVLSVATLAASAPCDELLTALHTLAHGSMAERWQLLDDGIPHVQELLGDNESVTACADRARSILFSVLRSEKDDRIVARLIDSLSWTGCDDLNGYPVEALVHRSPNVRRRAAMIIAESDCDRPLPQL